MSIVTPTYLSHENGTRRISDRDAEKYAALFGTTAQWILFRAGDEVRSSPQITGGDAGLFARVATVVEELIQNHTRLSPLQRAMILLALGEAKASLEKPN